MCTHEDVRWCACNVRGSINCTHLRWCHVYKSSKVATVFAWITCKLQLLANGAFQWLVEVIRELCRAWSLLKRLSTPVYFDPLLDQKTTCATSISYPTDANLTSCFPADSLLLGRSLRDDSGRPGETASSKPMAGIILFGHYWDGICLHILKTLLDVLFSVLFSQHSTFHCLRFLSCCNGSTGSFLIVFLRKKKHPTSSNQHRSGSREPQLLEAGVPARLSEWPTLRVAQPMEEAPLNPWSPWNVTRFVVEDCSVISY